MNEAIQEQKPPCLISGCDRPALTRGLCRACRSSLSKQVHARHLTMKDAEELGLIGPRHSGRRPGRPAGPMFLAIEKAIAERVAKKGPHE